MEFRVIGVTTETNGLTKEQLEEAKVFSGKNAGICYQREGYFGTVVSDPVAAGKRFPRVIGTNHHSIADHVRVEVLFENVSKMLAIVLNSLQDYSTSEKSGRYTVMTGNSERERELYEKWKGIFQERILELEPNIDDIVIFEKLRRKLPNVVFSVNERKVTSVIDDVISREDIETCLSYILSNDDTLPSIKLAQENARYVLSVFTKSTTLGYSTSLRQWNYIYDWCLKYMNNFSEEEEHVLRHKSGREATYFEVGLFEDFRDLSNFIYNNLYVEGLRDTKNRCFEFLTGYSGNENHPMGKYHIKEDDRVGDSYCVSYYSSFVQIAQAERHRTLKYFMQYYPTWGRFYIPEMIKEDISLVKEWLKDLNSVKDLVPQATMVGIIETGHISDFVLKCKERLCGRAQLEIMHQTKNTVELFLKGMFSFSDSGLAYLKELGIFSEVVGTKVATKCMMCGGCEEPCRYGAGGALDRKV